MAVLLINSGIFINNVGILINKLRYYADIASYTYLGLNILVFILVKGVYLLSAWVCCPAVYLKIKKIID